MRKFLFLCVCALFASVPAFAQTGARYRFDNFDTRQGVQIAAPPVKTAPVAKRVRLTARNSALNEAASSEQIKEEIYTRPRRAMLTAAVSKSLDGFSTGDVAIDALIVESGNRHGVDPKLIYSIMHRESSFKKHAVSYKGARGLMQLMPATAARLGVTNIFDPKQNIEGGVKYMSMLLGMFDNDVNLALAGYNAGEGAVIKYGRRIPPYSETQEYVRRISQRYELIRDPQTAQRAQVVTRRQVANIQANEKPAPLYEQNVYAVRLPDGRLRLVSQ